MTEKNLKEGGKLANVTLTWSHHQSPSGKHSNMTRCQIWGSFESHCGSKMNELVSVLVSGAFRRFENVLHSENGILSVCSEAKMADAVAHIELFEKSEVIK